MTYLTLRLDQVWLGTETQKMHDRKRKGKRRSAACASSARGAGSRAGRVGRLQCEPTYSSDQTQADSFV